MCDLYPEIDLYALCDMLHLFRDASSWLNDLTLLGKMQWLLLFFILIEPYRSLIKRNNNKKDLYNTGKMVQCSIPASCLWS